MPEPLTLPTPRPRRPASPRQRLLDLADLRDEYGLPQSTVRGLIHGGHLRAVTLPGARKLRVLRDDVERLIAASAEVR